MHRSGPGMNRELAGVKVVNRVALIFMTKNEVEKGKKLSKIREIPLKMYGLAN